MADLKLIQPYAGNWILPVLRFAGIAPSERQDVVIMVFEAEHGAGEARLDLSLKAPISRDCAAMLLRDLQALHAAAPLNGEWA